MKRTVYTLATTTTLLAIGTNAYAVVAYDNFGGDDLNLTSLTGEASYTSPGDAFNEYASGASAPFTLIDDSLGVFPAIRSASL